MLHAGAGRLWHSQGLAGSGILSSVIRGGSSASGRTRRSSPAVARPAVARYVWAATAATACSSVARC